MLTLRQTENFRAWESQLKDPLARAIIAARVNRLAHGLAGDTASVGSGVQELRIHYGPGYRVYFQRRENTIILLLCGGVKASQRRDILTARRLALGWKE